MQKIEGREMASAIAALAAEIPESDEEPQSVEEDQHSEAHTEEDQALHVFNVKMWWKVFG